MEKEQSSAKLGAIPDQNMEHAYRESARGVLNRIFERSHKRMEAIEVLLKVIPWDLLSKRDEEVLWDYFCEKAL